jgi:hypothetical protein
MHVPLIAQGFRASEDFFRQHVDGSAVARQSDSERFRGTLLKFYEIFAWQIQTVWMIDAKTCYRACAYQIKGKPVNGVKDFW